MRAEVIRLKLNYAKNKCRRKHEYQNSCDLTESHCERHRLQSYT